LTALRLTPLVTLLAVLAFAASAQAADSTTIWHDCQTNGRLTGHYSLAELRKAAANLPSDVDEYSNCSDVLSRAIADAAAASGSSSHGSSGGGTSGGVGGGSGGGSTGGGSGTSGGAGGAGGGTVAPTPTPIDEAAPVAPTLPQDQAALQQAAKGGAAPVEVGGTPVLPGGPAQLTADFGRNALPSPLIAAFALIVLALGAALTPRIRRLVLAHRSS